MRNLGDPGSFLDRVTCEKCGEEDKAEGGLEVPPGCSPPFTVHREAEL